MFFSPIHVFSFAGEKIAYQCNAIQILNSPRLTWDLETRHAILLQICTYLSVISCFWHFHWRMNNEHVSKIVIEGCWIHSIAFCSRSARFWDFHRKMKLFLGLALEDGGEATLQQGYHWIDQHVSEIVSGKCFWGCLCGIWTCFWGWDQLKMFWDFHWKMGSWKTGPWDAVRAQSKYE